jgi:steroid 5-alpha reductase family enzyme
MIPALASAAVFLCLAMALAWAVQRRTGNSGWIDTVWSFSVGASSIIALALLPGDGSRRVLLGALVSIWSLRLGWHILTRTGRTKDDPRYAKLMVDWGDAAPLRLFLFLQVQALAGLVLVGAVALAAASQSGVTAPGTLLFAVLAFVAVAGEATADAQLAACKRSKPPGGICENGLWTYSRHPNYFFEWLFWVAIAGIAIVPPTDGVALLAAAAPIMMFVLLRYGSGVPHIETHMRHTRPEAFADYVRRVPIFFPRLRR